MTIIMKHYHVMCCVDTARLRREIEFNIKREFRSDLCGAGVTVVSMAVAAVIMICYHQELPLLLTETFVLNFINKTKLFASLYG